MSDSLQPMNHSTSGLPVHHQLLKSTQTQVHWVSDAIQPSHPLSSPSPPILNLSQHQGLFKRVNSSHKVTKVLEFQLPSNEHPGLISFGMDWLVNSLDLKYLNAMLICVKIVCVSVCVCVCKGVRGTVEEEGERMI